MRAAWIVVHKTYNSGGKSNGGMSSASYSPAENTITTVDNNGYIGCGSCEVEKQASMLEQFLRAAVV